MLIFTQCGRTLKGFKQSVQLRVLSGGLTLRFHQPLPQKSQSLWENDPSSVEMPPWFHGNEGLGSAFQNKSAGLQICLFRNRGNAARVSDLP